MITCTDGLHALAGDTTRNVLMQFTCSLLIEAMIGVKTRATLQFSSTIKIVVVGFFGAGLIAFSISLGAILAPILARKLLAGLFFTWL